jgi:hypothetical protein
MHDLEDYEQGEQIGYGGFSDVFHARHVPSNRHVALKVSRPDAEAQTRMRREIEVQSTLGNANILPLLDWDAEGGRWFATEVAEGNLDQVHAKHPLTPAAVLRLLEEILGALGAAHRRGLVHRDVSPYNILRHRGVWVLADWGYVSSDNASPLSRLTRTGTRGGAFTWAAPEMNVDAHRAGPPADLFSLGRIGLWLLLGNGVLVDNPAELPEETHWRGFLSKMTDPDIDLRFPSAEEALAALAVVAKEVPPDAPALGLAASSVSAPPAVGASVGLTKRYLDGHRVQLHDLVKRVTEETVTAADAPRFNAGVPEEGDLLLERIDRYIAICRPMTEVIFTGCYYGRAEHEELWTQCIQRLVPTDLRGGYQHLNRMRNLPALLAMYAGALGAYLSRQYAAFAAVTLTPLIEVPDDRGELPALEVLGTAGATLDRSVLQSTTRYKQRLTPASDVLFDALRDVARTVLVSDSEYEEKFNRFEVMFSLVLAARGHWATGRFIGKNRSLGPTAASSAISKTRAECDRAGSEWAPLRAGLFESTAQIEAAFKAISDIASKAAWGG